MNEVLVTNTLEAFFGISPMGHVTYFEVLVAQF